VPGDVLQCNAHDSTHSGLPHRCNYFPFYGSPYFIQPWRVLFGLAIVSPHIRERITDEV
jgi:hypothetical protein